ncbi:hypothetical protein MMC06_004645 [Schaereria dolodes]|nr:hypothetical protein [Schaereria dolodes]
MAIHRTRSDTDTDSDSWRATTFIRGHTAFSTLIDARGRGGESRASIVEFAPQSSSHWELISQFHRASEVSVGRVGVHGHASPGSGTPVFPAAQSILVNGELTRTWWQLKEASDTGSVKKHDRTSGPTNNVAVAKRR